MVFGRGALRGKDLSFIVGERTESVEIKQIPAEAEWPDRAAADSAPAVKALLPGRVRKAVLMPLDFMPYRPTDDIRESAKCSVCLQPITGESARYFEPMNYEEVYWIPRHYPRASGPLGGGGRIRLHFIQHEFGG